MTSLMTLIIDQLKPYLDLAGQKVEFDRFLGDVRMTDGHDPL